MANPPNPVTPTGNPGQVGIANPPSRFHQVVWILALGGTFDVVIGSATVISNVIALLGGVKPIQFFDIFAHGELLIISVSITASALGSLILCLIRGKRTKITRSVVFLCLTALMLIFGVFEFTFLLGVGGKASDPVHFGEFSLIWYFCSIIVSLNCILAAEV